LIGIAVSGSLPVAQMNSLATATGSLADTDGDGMVDDRLVFTWSSSSAALRNTIVGAIEDLVGSIQFETVTLAVDDDPYGFVTGISPSEVDVSGTVSGKLVDFELTFRGAVAALAEDQVFKITLSVLGDGTILLDTIDVYVVVPGTEV
jgi:hypothetical protein